MERNTPFFMWMWRPSMRDRKSTRLNSSHLVISYAVFCLKKKKNSRPDDGEDQASSQRVLNSDQKHLGHARHQAEPQEGCHHTLPEQPRDTRTHCADLGHC